ncbi:MAG: response regulator [Candidatus Omnitrophota bacterium]
MGGKKPRRKILVVDDEKETRDSLGRILERRGYEMVVAEDGEQGLIKMKEFQPEIVICDIVMPKINGLQFLETIRNMGSQAQVIMITGQMFMSNCDDILKYNVCGYLLKPLQIDTILTHIAKAEDLIEQASKKDHNGLK